MSALDDCTEASRVIYDQARDMPDKVAVETLHRSLTYAQLAHLIDCCALHLHEKGVTDHAICALAVQDQLSLLIHWLALNRLRVGVVCIPVRQPVHDIESLITECAIKVAVSDRGFVWPGIKVVDARLDPSMRSFGGSLDLTANTQNRIEHVLLGSGSTGKPKLIAYEYGALMRMLQTFTNSVEVTSDDRYGPLINLQYGGPVTYCLIRFYVGATVVLYDRTVEDPFLFLERFEVRTTDATVLHAEQLYRLARKHGRRLEKMKDLSLSSSVVTESLVSRLNAAVTSEVSIEYDTNECWPVCRIHMGADVRPKGSVGRAIAHAAVEVVDDQHRPCPTNLPGHVRMRSPGMFSGYIGQQEETQRRLQSGWFYPGDVGKLNAEGHLILLGRSDHMMFFNGVNIYPAEIERVMADHPSVTDAAVVPFKHEIHQDVPVCAVTLHPSHQTTEAELLEYGQKRLGTRSAKFVFVVEEVPRNHLGKLIRSDMAEILMARMKPWIR